MQMFKVKCSPAAEDRIASVIPISLIQRSIHLLPKWGGPVPQHWTSENVLDECTTFYVNTFKDAHTYFNLY